MTEFSFPQALLDDLRTGRPPLTPWQRNQLSKILTALEDPMPELWPEDALARENRLWTKDIAEHYLGEKSADHTPGDIDPRLAWIIGQADPDSPIALDFRVTPPRVVYFGTVDYQCFWIEIASSYENFIAAITPARAE